MSFLLAAPEALVTAAAAARTTGVLGAQLPTAAPTNSVTRQRCRLCRHSTHTGGMTPSTISNKAP
jgi:hypothetical protein